LTSEVILKMSGEIAIPARRAGIAISPGIFRPSEASMAKSTAKDVGTKEKPWALKTPPGTSEYQMYRDEAADPPALVCVVGKTELRYHLRCIEDLHAMLKKHGDWMLLGSADEQKPAAEGTVEAWGRSPDNPVKGWYGLKKGLRGRFGMYLPPLLEALGLAELEHNPKNNRMRAK
jgi:hypothetical protein